MIHADFGGYRLLGVARLLEISFQRDQHLIRVNYTFFWQLIYLRFRLAAQKYKSLATTLKRAPEVLTSRGRRDKPTQTLNTPAQLRFVRLGSRFVMHTDARRPPLIENGLHWTMEQSELSIGCVLQNLWFLRRRVQRVDGSLVREGQAIGEGHRSNMLVSCPRNSRCFVAIKMGRRQGARREHI